jgi:hypothetical protein
MIQRCNPVKVLLSLRVQTRRTRKKNPKPKKKQKEKMQTTSIHSFHPSFLPFPPRAPSLAPHPQCNSRRLVPSLLLVYKQKTQPPAGIRQMDSTTPVCSPPPQQQQLLVAGSLLLPGGSQYMARSDATTNKRSDREHLLELEHKLLEARQRVGCCCHKSCRLFL